MEKSLNTEIQEVIINVKSEREANSPSGNESQNGEVEHQNRELLKDITQMLGSWERPLPPECCIYRVPLDLRNLNKEAYTPKVISIGPFHNGVKRLKAMEKRKVRCFKMLVDKTKIEIKKLVSTIRDKEEDVRHCYSEASRLSSNNYVKMILLDASFIIVFFLSFWFDEWWNCDGSRTFTMRLISTIMSDIWLLENQLPFFVIEELYKLAFSSPSKYPSFTELTFQSFKGLVSSFFLPENMSPPSPTELTCQSFKGLVSSFFLPENMSPPSPTELTFQSFKDLVSTFFLPENMSPPRPILTTELHFVDLVRTLSLAQSERLQKRNIGKKVRHLYSASQLDEAGVKFKVGLSKCLFDLKFTNGVLEIPCLTLYADTGSLFRNLVAFEQCHHKRDHYVTDYIYVLDFLIDTNKDVDLLVRKGILVNTLGDSNAVTTLVNKLSQQTSSLPMNSYYSDLCERLNAFYSIPCNKWKAILRRDYFSTPWRIASTVAAIILLVLTFIQTVRSFY